MKKSEFIAKALSNVATQVVETFSHSGDEFRINRYKSIVKELEIMADVLIEEGYLTADMVEEKSEKDAAMLDKNITELESLRGHNKQMEVLDKRGIIKVKDLLELHRYELLKLPNIGAGTIKKIDAELQVYGYRLQL